jgi:hypothetical protein
MEFHKWLAAHQPQLLPRFMFITGGAFTPQARDYLAQQQVPLLEKPFNADTLRNMVNKIATGV